MPEFFGACCGHAPLCHSMKESPVRVRASGSLFKPFHLTAATASRPLGLTGSVLAAALTSTVLYRRPNSKSGLRPS